ncbi:hypothetical protein HOL83_02680, partial [Candidatus Woesearchaeota archaeon]|nr:hypothetical protein [Candidatus Woesearchaeota archaeon]MBT5272215.1 hypothetical protein [Candidatus Woesearchaeota archaeon]
MVRKTSNWMEKAKKVFAILSIYLMIGMVFASSVLSAPPVTPEDYPSQETKPTEFWKAVKAGGEWQYVDWTKSSLKDPNYWVENDIDQSKIPPEYIDKIPPEVVDVNKVMDKSKLTSDQLAYSEDGTPNVEKIPDLGVLDQKELSGAINKAYGTELKIFVLPGSTIKNGVLRGPGQPGNSNMPGVDWRFTIDLKDEKVKNGLKGALISGVDYNDQGKQYSGFIVCVNDGTCTQFTGHVKEIAITPDGDFVITPKGEGEPLVIGKGGNSHYVVTADGLIKVEFGEKTDFSFKGVSFVAEGTDTTSVIYNENEMRISGPVTFESYLVSGYNNEGVSSFKFKPETAELVSVKVSNGELTFNDPDRNGDSRFVGGFEINIDENHITDYTLLSEGSYSHLEEYGLKRFTLNDNGPHKVKLYYKDGEEVLTIRVILAKQNILQDKFNNLAQHVKDERERLEEVMGKCKDDPCREDITKQLDTLEADLKTQWEEEIVRLNQEVEYFRKVHDPEVGKEQRDALIAKEIADEKADYEKKLKKAKRAKDEDRIKQITEEHKEKLQKLQEHQTQSQAYFNSMHIVGISGKETYKRDDGLTEYTGQVVNLGKVTYGQRSDLDQIIG